MRKVIGIMPLYLHFIVNSDTSHFTAGLLVRIV